MKSKNTLLATGIAVGVSLAANVAPASADSGGLEIEMPTASGMGGMPEAKGPNQGPQAKISQLEYCADFDIPVQAQTLDASVLDHAPNEAVSITASGITEAGVAVEIINPIAVLTHDGKNIADYVGYDPDTNTLYAIPDKQAKVFGHLGKMALPVDEHAALTSHRLTVSAPKGSTTGFTAENGESFGMVKVTG